MPTLTKEQLIEEVNNAVADGLITQRIYERVSNSIHGIIIRDDNPFWQFRESVRHRCSIYPRLSFDGTPHWYEGLWLDTKNSAEVLYVHPSTANANMVAFTKDTAHGENDVQSIMKVGKYLKKYSTASADQINEFANWFTQTRKTAMAKDTNKGELGDNNVLHLTRNPKTVHRVYTTCATGSCMSYDATKWSLKLSYIARSPLKELEPCIARAQQYFDSLEEDEYIHPSVMYAFSPELAVAYYMEKNRVVARTIVNLQTEQAGRIYGNLHLATLLKQEDFEVSNDILDFHLPVVMAQRESGEQGILMPYVDHKDITPYAYTNKHAGVLEIPSPSSKKDASLYPAGSSMGVRHYATGIIPFNGQNACDDCGIFIQKGYEAAWLTGIIGGAQDKYLCDPCAGHIFEKYTKNHTFCWRAHPRADENDDVTWFCDFVPNEETEHIKDLSLPHAMLNGDNCYLHNTARQAVDAFNSRGKAAFWYDTRRVHKEDLNYVIPDGFLYDTPVLKGTTNIAISPESEQLVDTIAEICNVRGFAGEKLRRKYGSSAIIEMAWDRYSFDLIAIKLSGRRKMYAMAEHCEAAITDVHKRTTLLPRSLCYYSMHTGEWFAKDFVQSKCTSTSLIRTLVQEDFTNHPKTLLEAARVFANIKLHSMVITTELTETYWKENHAFTGQKKVEHTIKLV